MIQFTDRQFKILSESVARLYTELHSLRCSNRTVNRARRIMLMVNRKKKHGKKEDRHT